MDLALDNLQWLICHQTKPRNLTKFFQLRSSKIVDSLKKTEFFRLNIKIYPKYKNKNPDLA